MGASTLGGGVTIGNNRIVWAATREDGTHVGNRCVATAAYTGPNASIGLSRGAEWSRDDSVENVSVEGDRGKLERVDAKSVAPTPDEAGIVIGAGASIPGDTQIPPASVIRDDKHFRNAERPDRITIDSHADRSAATCNGLEERRREVAGAVNPAAAPGERPSRTATK